MAEFGARAKRKSAPIKRGPSENSWWKRKAHLVSTSSQQFSTVEFYVAVVVAWFKLSRNVCILSENIRDLPHISA